MAVLADHVVKEGEFGIVIYCKDFEEFKKINKGLKKLKAELK